MAATVTVPLHQTGADAAPAVLAIPEQRDAPLDGIRGIAVLAVMAFHVWQDVPARTALDRMVAGAIGFGWTGVDLFFVLSGFLITRILYGARQSPRYFTSFYARRLLRTFPLYYFALFLVLGVPALLGRRLVEESAWWFALHASNIMAVLEGYPRRIVVHFWSLSIEEQFYLFWPVAIRALRTRARMLRFCAALVAGALALRAAWWLLGHPHPREIYNFTLTRMDALASGGLLALWLAAPGDRNRRLRILAVVTAVSAIVVGIGLSMDGPNHLRWKGWNHILSFSAVALGCAGLVGWSQLAPAGHRLNHWLSARVLVFFGQYSYAMYVFHIWVDAAARAVKLHPAVNGLSLGGTTAPMLAYFALFLVVTSGVALTSWRLLEQRILAYKRHFPF